MGLNKRLIGGAAAGGAVPTNTDNFDIVTYTGTGSTYNVGDGQDASVTINSGTANYARGSVSHSTGKRYFEVEYISANGASNTLMVGIINTAYVESWTNAQTKMYYAGNGNKYTGGSGTSYGGTYAPGDIIGVAYDGTNRTITFYKNNVSQGTAFTGLITNYPSYFAAIGTGLYSETAQFRFTSSEFTYTPPSGYSEWGSSTVSAHSGTVNSAVAGQPIDFQPNLVWIKDRTSSYEHIISDSVRGTSKEISSNTTDAEESRGVSAFNSNGFSFSDGNINYNKSGDNYVAWCWKAGGTAVSNTDGTITSQVSANQDAGFSIVSYTGNGSNATVGHGLSSAPELLIIKQTDAARNWLVSPIILGNNYYGILNSQSAFGTDNGNTNGTTSTVINLLTGAAANSSGGDYIAYCFHSVSGYQKIGSYSGGSTSTISTGFKPRFIIVKRTNRDGDDWHLFDSTREGDDSTDKILKPNTSDSEGNGGADRTVNFTSDGFNWTNANSNAVNASGGEYIYLAIA